MIAAGVLEISTTKPNEQTRTGYLQHFPTLKRSTVMNSFLSPPRNGVTDPHEIVQLVCQSFREKAEHAWSAESEQTALNLLALIQSHPDESLAFAQYAVAYVALPEPAREVLKREKAAEHVSRWMTENPATDKQIAYLKVLGYDGDVANRAHASQLINALKSKTGGRK